MPRPFHFSLCTSTARKPLNGKSTAMIVLQPPNLTCLTYLRYSPGPPRSAFRHWPNPTSPLPCFFLTPIPPLSLSLSLSAFSFSLSRETLFTSFPFSFSFSTPQRPNSSLTLPSPPPPPPPSDEASCVKRIGLPNTKQTTTAVINHPNAKNAGLKR